MGFLVHIPLTTEQVPTLSELLGSAQERMAVPVELDSLSRRAAESGSAPPSWCPWPREAVATYVPGASTRGAEVTLEQTPQGVTACVAVPALATWTDWCLGVSLARALCDRGGGAEIVGVGAFLAEGLSTHFEDDDATYLAECAAGALALEEAIREGRIVRVGGPAGYAAIGPRTWLELDDTLEDPDEFPLALVERIQGSIECRGYDGFHRANPLCIDGRDGQQVVAALLAPDQPTILRDPQYILLGADLEAGPGAPMYLLPFSDLQLALPGRATWLDDRTAAVTAIPAAAWPQTLASLGPWLVTVEELLDEQYSGVPSWTQYLDVPRLDQASQKPWWKFW